MSIFDRFKAKPDTEVKGYMNGEDNTINEFFKNLYKYVGSSLRPSDFPTYDRKNLLAMYTNNAEVFGVVDTITRACGELANFIELVDKDNNLVDKSPILDLLNKPNDLQTLQEFIADWATNMLVFGDAFVYFEKGVGSKSNILKSGYVIPSHIVTINSRGYLKPIDNFALETNYTLDSTLTPANTMFSRFNNPNPMIYYGLSPLATAAQNVTIIENSKKRQNTSLINGGANSIISPEGTDMIKSQLDDFEKKLNGLNAANKNVPVTIPVRVQKIGDAPADLNMIEISKNAINALCVAYHISVDTYLSQAKYENAKEAKKQIYESAAIPLLNIFCAKLATFADLSKVGQKLIINTDKIEVLNDLNTMLDIYIKANATLNEKRNLMGLSEIEQPYANEPMLTMGTQFGDYTFDINENNTTTTF